jgi:hypothetical protein
VERRLVQEVCLKNFYEKSSRTFPAGENCYCQPEDRRNENDDENKKTIDGGLVDSCFILLQQQTKPEVSTVESSCLSVSCVIRPNAHKLESLNF